MKKESNLTSYYAYNKKYSDKGIKKASELKFASLNKGFYDELILAQMGFKTSKRELDKITGNTMKESVFLHQKLPSNWKTKLGFREQVIDLIKTDNNFARYLAERPIESNGYKAFMAKTLSPTPHNPNHPFLPNISSKPTQKDPSTQKVRPTLKSSQSKVFNFLSSFNFHTANLSDKFIASKLEDYRTKYDMKKFIDGIQMKLDNELGDLEPEDDENIEKKEKKVEKKKKKGDKTKVLKESIYINLLPKEEEDKRMHTFGIFDNKGKTQYSPFLNSNEELNRKIEITNPKIKRDLEIIDYYGPRYTHCKICNNKNLDYYQHSETKQCIKLLGYLKKIREKNNRDFQPVHVCKILNTQ